MTAHHPRRAGRGNGRRWFIRTSATRTEGRDVDLAHLLAALSAPARPDELAGEETVMQFFRAVHPHPAPQEVSRPVRQAVAGRRVVLKVAAAVVVATVTATGAVSLAATNGLLHNPLGGGSRDATPDQHPAVKPSPDPDADHGAVPSGPAPGESARTLLALCRTYRVAAANRPGRPPEDPAFAVLIAAAGGRDQVAAYCDAVVDPLPGRGASPGPAPTESATPALPGSADPAPTPTRTTDPAATPTTRADPTPRPSHRRPSPSPHGSTKPSKPVRAVPQTTSPDSSGGEQSGRFPADPITRRAAQAPAGRPPGPSPDTPVSA